MTTLPAGQYLVWAVKQGTNAPATFKMLFEKMSNNTPNIDNTPLLTAGQQSSVITNENGFWYQFAATGWNDNYAVRFTIELGTIVTSSDFENPINLEFYNGTDFETPIHTETVERQSIHSTDTDFSTIIHATTARVFVKISASVPNETIYCTVEANGFEMLQLGQNKAVTSNSIYAITIPVDMVVLMTKSSGNISAANMIKLNVSDYHQFTLGDFGGIHVYDTVLLYTEGDPVFIESGTYIFQADGNGTIRFDNFITTEDEFIDFGIQQSFPSNSDGRDCWYKITLDSPATITATSISMYFSINLFSPNDLVNAITPTSTSSSNKIYDLSAGVYYIKASATASTVAYFTITKS